HRIDPRSDDDTGISELVELSDAGVPTITYSRPLENGTLHTVHDYARASPDFGAGLAWNSFRSWLDRPPITTGVHGFFSAGPFSPGGSAPSAVVLSGALASYGCHDYLA
ncbi:MAG: hypothetical protein ABWY56_02470, partial [Propionibacteriaceae bacterium]